MKQIFLSRKGIEVKEVPELFVDKGKNFDKKSIFMCFSRYRNIIFELNKKKVQLEK